MAKKYPIGRIKVVLDASVYLAGMGSVGGGSRLILEAAKTGAIKVVMSALVVDEVKRNFRKFTSGQKDYFLGWIAAVEPKVVRLTEKEVEKQAEMVVSKDAHVLALAVKARANFLVTLDKKHLLKLRGWKRNLAIVNTGEFLEWLRRDGD